MEFKTAQDTSAIHEIEISVRPMPRQHIVRVKLPRQLFDDRIRSASLAGSADPNREVSIVSLVEAAQRFEGQQVVEVDSDSLVCRRDHDGVAIAGMVMFMPELSGSHDQLLDFRAGLEHFCSIVHVITQSDINNEIETLLRQHRKDKIVMDQPAKMGDLVLLDVWNTGLSKDAKVQLVLRLGKEEKELSDALVGQTGGLVLIGSYPIKEARAQKIQLIGLIEKGQYGRTELCRDLNTQVDQLDQYVKERIENNISDRLRLWMLKHSTKIEIDPIPIDLIGQIALLQAQTEVDQDGPATTMRRYGVETMEALVEAVIETRVGIDVRVDIVLYWLSQRLWGDPPESVLRVYCQQHKISNRAVALLHYSRDLVLQNCIKRIKIGQQAGIGNSFPFSWNREDRDESRDER